MKRLVGGWIAAVVTACCWCRAESVNVVQITDMRGQVGYQVMDREEFTALTKEIREEVAAFPAAAAESKKEWDANKENKLSFQGNRIKPRSAKKMGQTYMDRDKAEKKRSQLEERASERQAEELEKEAKKAKLSRSNEEEVAKQEARLKAFEDAFAMISKKMGEKLGRPVPSFGLSAFDPGQGLPKKDAKKAGK